LLKHPASYVFFGIGFLALVFAVARTYYLMGRMNREREDKDFRPFSPGEAGKNKRPKS
jgi:hypothetical protein